MSRPRSAQELIHWLEVGGGARWIRLAAMLALILMLSLRVAWTQFHGPVTEMTLLQADTGRQLARGEGFSTLVNYPQVAAFLQARGVRFQPSQAYPELYQAPLYPLVIAGARSDTSASSGDSSGAMRPTMPMGSVTVKLKCGEATGFTLPSTCSYLSAQPA